MESLPELVDDLDSAEVIGEGSYLDHAANFAANHTPTKWDNKPARAPKVKPTKRDAAGYGPCTRCSGTGRWSSFSMGMGPSRGVCFKCNGSGNGVSLDPKAVRARERAAQRKADAEQALIDRAAAFRAARPDIVAWWAANVARFDFARSTQTALAQRGELTENQIAAIERCIAGEADRKAARDAKREESAVKVGGDGFDKLLAMFAKAGAKLKNPALIFDRVCFKPAKAHSANAGYIYVTGGKSFGSDYYGKINPQGSFYPVRECPDDIKAEVARIGADPLSEVVLHGKKTGQCACCGRALENELSVERGIGPICFERYFG